MDQQYEATLSRLNDDIRDAIHAYVGANVAGKNEQTTAELKTVSKYAADSWFVQDVLDRLRRNWRFVERARQQRSL